MTAPSELNRRKERVILPTWGCTRISRYVKPREGNDLSCGGVIATCYSTVRVFGMRVDSIFNLIHYSKVCKAEELEHGILVGGGLD